MIFFAKTFVKITNNYIKKYISKNWQNINETWFITNHKLVKVKQLGLQQK